MAASTGDDALALPPEGGGTPVPVAKGGACHRCSAEFRGAGKPLQCPACLCRYHTHDCGKRIETAGLGPEMSKACPKCEKLCMCAGGPVTCHPGRTKRRREKAAYLSREEAAAAAAAGAGAAAAPRDAHAVGSHLAMLPGFSPGAPGPGGGGSSGLAPPGHLGSFPPFHVTSGADLTQAIQLMAARALISCVPEALSGVNPTVVVTAANAAAAAFSVTLMSLIAQPSIAPAPPPAPVLDPRYYDLALFRQQHDGMGAAAAPHFWGQGGLGATPWTLPPGARVQSAAGGAATPPGQMQPHASHGGGEAPHGGGGR